MATFSTSPVLVRRAILALAAIACLPFLPPIAGLTALAQTEANEHLQKVADPIEGSWICNIDRIGQGISFTALTSFTAGGVVLATGSLDKLNPISSVYGSWKRSGGNRVTAILYFFLFDPGGYPIGMLKTNEAFVHNGENKLTGIGSSFVCDVDGKNCSNHGTEVLVDIVGKRIVP